MSTQASTVSPWIITARHVLGIAVVSLASPYVLHQVEPLYFWASTALGAIAFGSALAGLLYVFFTKRQRGRFFQTWWYCMWVCAALLLIGHWTSAGALNPIAAKILGGVAFVGVIVVVVVGAARLVKMLGLDE